MGQEPLVLGERTAEPRLDDGEGLLRGKGVVLDDRGPEAAREGPGVRRGERDQSLHPGLVREGRVLEHSPDGLLLPIGQLLDGVVRRPQDGVEDPPVSRRPDLQRQGIVELGCLVGQPVQEGCSPPAIGEERLRGALLGPLPAVYCILDDFGSLGALREEDERDAEGVPAG